MNKTVHARNKSASKSLGSAPSESSNRIFVIVMYVLLGAGILLIGGIIYAVLLGVNS